MTKRGKKQPKTGFFVKIIFSQKRETQGFGEKVSHAEVKTASFVPFSHLTILGEFRMIKAPRGIRLKD